MKRRVYLFFYSAMYAHTRTDNRRKQQQKNRRKQQQKILFIVDADTGE